MPIELQAERLELREFTTDDAPFIVNILNQPSFLRFIGDKGVRTLDDARNYLTNGPIDSYHRHGFGLYLVELTHSKTPIGMCGLVKRDSLTHVDLGFAFLPEFWGKGYAFEAAASVLKYAREFFKLDRILAITDPDNEASIKLLQKLGFDFDGMIKLSDEAPEIRLFSHRRQDMNLNKIHQISVYAKDLEEAIAFYRDKLGAKFLQKFDPPGLVFFDFSGTRLLLEQTGPKATLYFRVDDIDAAYEEFKANGIEFIREPHLIFRDDSGMFGTPGEEEWMAFFKDPSDNTLALATRKRIVLMSDTL